MNILQSVPRGFKAFGVISSIPMVAIPILPYISDHISGHYFQIIQMQHVYAIAGLSVISGIHFSMGIANRRVRYAMPGILATGCAITAGIFDQLTLIDPNLEASSIILCTTFSGLAAYNFYRAGQGELPIWYAKFLMPITLTSILSLYVGSLTLQNILNDEDDDDEDDDDDNDNDD